ncbi:MAG TPA: NAD(P)H-hydrate dehydratase [Verrucomicrobiae bacterium]|nr:NAD(P)H-hydrate dehydratase [Verrucomicrobiae bacterium]
MKILSVSEMREVDRLTTERCGISQQSLMEEAGGSVARFVARHFAPIEERRVALLCGKGNNGGDGFVAARALREMGAEPEVFFFGVAGELAGEAAEAFKRMREGNGGATIRVKEICDGTAWEAAREEIFRAQIILDALLGTGLRGPVEGLLAQVVEAVNHRDERTRVVAVDIPSGISGDAGAIADGLAVMADYTVTFTAPKNGMLVASAAPFVGRLTVAAIGSPAELVEEVAKGNVRWMEPWEVRRIPFHRKADSNKGLYGHALIVAGSVGKAGAAALAAQGALRTGAGLVTVATPEPVLATVAGFAPEVMTEPLHATPAGTITRDVFDSGGFAKILKGKNALAMGPGLTTQEETRQFVKAVIGSKPAMANGSPVPIILDADGLNAFDGGAKELRGEGRMLVVTPHPGEMGRLVGCTAKEVQANRLTIAREAAADWNAHVILKGNWTVIAAPDGRAWINSTGNPGMSSGGTGDVLTGMLAGLTAQFGAEKNWAEMLALGVYLHGLAGDLAAEEFGEAPMVATDLVRCIPAAFAQMRDALGKESGKERRDP